MAPKCRQELFGCELQPSWCPEGPQDDPKEVVPRWPQNGPMVKPRALDVLRVMARGRQDRYNHMQCDDDMKMAMMMSTKTSYSENYNFCNNF